MFIESGTVTKRSVRFKQVPAKSQVTEEPLTWVFERPGTYRDKDDPMKREVWPVDSVTVIVEGSPGHWTVKSVTVECHLDDKIQTHMIDSTKYTLMPGWLARLVSKAVQ